LRRANTMNINELFGSEKDKEKDLGYDLKDDVIFFMNNDPEFYRKRYFPAMLKFDQYCKEGKQVSHRGFEKLVKEAYAIYQNKFPVEGLEQSLKDDMCEEICKEIHIREVKNCEDGVYDLED
jgi:hypothetical protein